jgi:hypothetical protein
LQNDVHVTPAKVIAGEKVPHVLEPQPGPRFYSVRDTHRNQLPVSEMGQPDLHDIAKPRLSS